VRLDGIGLAGFRLVLGWQLFHAMTLAGTTEDE
jgi:hypothetical protein